MSRIKELLANLPLETARDRAIRNLAKSILRELSEDDLELLETKSKLRPIELWADETELRSIGQKIRRIYTMRNQLVYYYEKIISLKRLC